MKEITLKLRDIPSSDDLQRDMNGLKVIAGNFCPKHKVGVLLIGPNVAEHEAIDAKCAIDGLMGLMDEVMLAKFATAAEAKPEGGTPH